jgi:hypothetical protein
MKRVPCWPSYTVKDGREGAFSSCGRVRWVRCITYRGSKRWRSWDLKERGVHVGFDYAIAGLLVISRQLKVEVRLPGGHWLLPARLFKPIRKPVRPWKW